MEESIGAFWLKTGKDGKKFMTGVVNGVKVVVFKNNFKKEEKHPDYRVFESKPLDTPQAPLDEEDIPF